VLMETWVEKRGWERMRNRLLKGYKWGGGGAMGYSKRKKRVSVKIMIMGVRKELIDEEERINMGTEGIIIRDIKQGKKRWRMVSRRVGLANG